MNKRVPALLLPLLLAGCRIPADLPTGEKILVGLFDVVVIAAALFAAMLLNYWISTRIS